MRERKRHTDRGISSTPSVSWGGVPPRDGYPLARSAEGGYLRWGTPRPGLMGEVTQGGVPPSQVWWGTQCGVPPSRGTPCSQVWQGVPKVGYPPSMVTPAARSDGGGYPRWGNPPAGPGLDTLPPAAPGSGTPPPPVWTDRLMDRHVSKHYLSSYFVRGR